MQRLVRPEILDSLPPDDPAALRSRRDLRRINAMMGNLDWLRRSLQAASLRPGADVIEVGAGDGTFVRALAQQGYRVTAIDLSPRPKALSESVRWIRGDLFAELPQLSGDVLVGNLCWHHFDDEQLAVLAPLMDRFSLIIASEPLRACYPWALGALLTPFVNSVTRHDLFTSIRAGFRFGELARYWQLDSEHWRIEESTSLLGACRLTAQRRSQ